MYGSVPRHTIPDTNTSTTTTSSTQKKRVCPSGHELSSAPLYCQWTCDRCRQNSYGGTANSCRKCNFDCCTSCADALASSSHNTTSNNNNINNNNTNTSTLLCPAQHEMKIIDAPIYHQWNCTYCKSQQLRGGTEYTCGLCGIIWCTSCAQKYQASVSKYSNSNTNTTASHQPQQQQQQHSSVATTNNYNNNNNNNNAAVPSHYTSGLAGLDDEEDEGYLPQKSSSTGMQQQSGGYYSGSGGGQEGYISQQSAPSLQQAPSISHFTSPSGHMIRPTCCYFLQGKCRHTADTCKYVHERQDGVACQYSTRCAAGHYKMLCGGGGGGNNNSGMSTTSSSLPTYQQHSAAKKEKVKCPKCTKVLVRTSLPSSTVWKCDVCSNTQHGAASYGCRDDNYDICQSCVTAQQYAQADVRKEKVKCPTCSHVLVRTSLPSSTVWRCDVCANTNSGGFSFGCRDDNFDICQSCVTSQQQAQAASAHHQHSMSTNTSTNTTSTTSALASAFSGKPAVSSATTNSHTTTSQQQPSSSTQHQPVTTTTTTTGGVKCRKGHLLTRQPMPSSTVWCCDNCKKKITGGFSMSCRGDKLSSGGCDYDIGDAGTCDCYNNMLLTSKLPETVFLCPNSSSHAMKKVDNRLEWNCKGCMKRFHRASCFHCNSCLKNYDLCIHCADDKLKHHSSASSALSSTSHATTANHHHHHSPASSSHSPVTTHHHGTTTTTATTSHNSKPASKCKNYPRCPCDSFSGKFGDYCCRSCRNGKVCTQAYHKFTGSPTTKTNTTSTSATNHQHHSPTTSHHIVSPAIQHNNHHHNVVSPNTAHHYTPASKASTTNYATQQHQHHNNNNVTNSSSASNASGKCKSVFVGCNYPGTKAALSGCHNDVRVIMNLLASAGFDLSNKKILVDDARFPGKTGEPTRRNIEEAMKWLAEDDGTTTRFFHFSGHGVKVKEEVRGEEADGQDNCIVPGNYQQCGLIRDNWINEHLCKKIPANTRANLVFDMCHSGSCADMEYEWKWKGEEKQFEPRKKPVKTRDFMRVSNKKCDADIIMFSGCNDAQTSSDVSNVSDFNHQFSQPGSRNQAGGACTNALAEAFSLKKSMTFMELFFRLQESLKLRKFKQIPVLSCSKNVNLTGEFSWFGKIS